MLLYLVDRPTVTQSTRVLAPDEILVEAGYTNSSYPPIGSVAVYPQARVRIGTAMKRLEIAVKAPGEVRTVGIGASDDLQTDLKYLVFAGKHSAMSAEVGADFDSGTIGNNGTQTSFTLNGEYALSPIFMLRTTQTLTAENVGGLAYGEYTPSFALSALVHGKTLLIGEYAASTRYNGPGSAARTRYELGATHAIGPRLMFDVEASESPSANGVPKNTALGLGAAYRFP